MGSWSQTDGQRGEAGGVHAERFVHRRIPRWCDSSRRGEYYLEIIVILWCLLAFHAKFLNFLCSLPSLPFFPLPFLHTFLFSFFYFYFFLFFFIFF
ncbi:MAG: hypothetical protein FE78DRAFT_261865 [Acidomyces sp. 'richmondensis']|nr:MAG: hypothetical protein FE78DRAFT_261865 [Acidomyces sp. 'richmondensis']